LYQLVEYKKSSL